LPEGLYNLDVLKRLRPIVYAVIHAFTWTLDDSLGLIGRLVEIGALPSLNADHPRASSLPIFSAGSIETARHGYPEGFSTGLPPNFGDSLDQNLALNVRASMFPLPHIRRVHC
jgi:hypothetical protein